MIEVAKIRSLKPEFFSSEQIVSVSIPARYLFEGIWVFGDDEGLIKHSPMSLKMKVFPGDSIEVEPLVCELLREGLVIEVSSDQGPLLWAPNVQVHQSPKRPTPTKFTRVTPPFSARYSAAESGNVPPVRGTRGEQGTAEAPPEPPLVALERSGEERKGEEGNTSEVADATRPDVERLLDLLDEELQKNGVKRLPKRNKANRDAMRLLLDRDGRSEEQVANAIRWAQSNEFWRSNILSASKLREKYETLRAQAARGRRAPAVVENISLAERYEAEERKELGA
ncbi:hypothetical protein B4915_02185 [Leucobacter massiliensis]|uniref:Uncharacterized protein n=1 Tax=Leucobacter massiliensis TaxID=1686285 RepID=A0A2S9QQP9_9MICO|nr:hypothetical protein B4915_02185 [Leucobacter massiliensis]